jgi:hypothetical protein
MSRVAAQNVPSQDAPYDMANLFPDSTGLPMTIWISARGYAQHDVRIKANQQDGNRMDPGNTAVVAVRPGPSLLHGTLSTAQQAKLFDWVSRNEAILVELWEGSIDFVGFVTRMQKV